MASAPATPRPPTSSSLLSLLSQSPNHQEPKSNNGHPHTDHLLEADAPSSPNAYSSSPHLPANIEENGSKISNTGKKALQYSSMQSESISPPSPVLNYSGSKTPLSPLLQSGAKTPQSPLIVSGGQTPRTPPAFSSPGGHPSPIGSPLRSTMHTMKLYLEDIGHLTKFNPQDAWLPITESRSGNAFYAAFHNLNAGIGFQGLLLPFAMFYLGWTWGILSLVIAYVWQLYTMWILTRLHEAVPGIRHSRYVQLAQAAFGNRLGYWLAAVPNFYLTAGTATALIVVGGGALKLFYKILCGPDCGTSPLSTIEWYFVFAMLSAVLAQLPNLNSIAGLSLVGAITAIMYCTMLWTLSISRERPPGVSYTANLGKSMVDKVFLTLNALGIVAFSFRGHNLAMEIQATMPSALKRPAHIAMWRGTKVANAIVAACYFPIAIAGYWAYGSMMLPEGILFSVYAFHQKDIARAVLGLLFILVVINCLTSFQIYSFTIFDIFEAAHTAKRNRPIRAHVRVMFRVLYVFACFFVGAALPWLSSLSGMLGGVCSAPVTFAFPCFMWLAIMKPKRYTFGWYLNWSLGVIGMLMAVAFTAGGIWSTVKSGITLHFFRPS